MRRFGPPPVIVVPYRIGPSRIPGAGRGCFTRAAVARSQVLIAPSHIEATVRLEELLALPAVDPRVASSARWFEDHCTIAPDWPDECFLNHAFAPTGIWHLGFVFAARALAPDTEITVDYRHLLAPGVEAEFLDAATGMPIRGAAWPHSLAESARTLLRLLEGDAAPDGAAPHPV